MRHGTADQPSFETSDDFKHSNPVKAAIPAVREPADLEQVGMRVGPYTALLLTDYRKRLSSFSYEAKGPLSWSFYPDNFEDYYVVLGDRRYRRSISFGHDFIGQDTLLAAKDKICRTKVTLEFNRDDIAPTLGEDS